MNAPTAVGLGLLACASICLILSFVTMATYKDTGYGVGELALECQTIRGQLSVQEGTTLRNLDIPPIFVMDIECSEIEGTHGVVELLIILFVACAILGIIFGGIGWLRDE